LWLSQDDPSFELSRVVNYIIYIWAEVFLMAKHRNTVVEGPRLLLLETMLINKYCSNPEKMMLATSISINGQMAHHETILLSLLASPLSEDRDLAINIIFGIRELGQRTCRY
jgi:hypothetical protein